MTAKGQGKRFKSFANSSLGILGHGLFMRGVISMIDPNYVVIGGLIICCLALICAVIAVVILRLAKARLNKRLDTEYGRRR